MAKVFEISVSYATDKGSVVYIERVKNATICASNKEAAMEMAKTLLLFANQFEEFNECTVSSADYAKGFLANIHYDLSTFTLSEEISY